MIAQQIGEATDVVSHLQINMTSESPTLMPRCFSLGEQESYFSFAPK